MVTKLLKQLALLILLCTSFAPAFADHPQALLMSIDGAIGPAAQDYVMRGILRAENEHKQLVILQLNTPGGLESAMMGINELILASDVPVVVYVAPKGATVSTQGIFILYAAHIAAMAPGTTIGTTAPDHLLSIDSSNQNFNPLQKKAFSSILGTIRDLAQLRGRNAAWAEQTVQHAASISAAEAVKLHVADFMATDTAELLRKINGRTVVINNAPQLLQTKATEIIDYPPKSRYQILTILTKPNVTYLLFLIGLYGLFFEFMRPGLVLPGLLGSVSLLLALYAAQLLPINYAALTLILTAFIFIISETYMKSYGILGLVGMVVFILGSRLLIETDVSAYQLNPTLVMEMSVVTVGFFLLTMNIGQNFMRRQTVAAKRDIIGCEGVVLEYKNQDEVMVRILGTLWQAAADERLYPGQKVRVVGVQGLILTVEPIKSRDRE